jgi:hypothetical protein
MRRRTEDMQTEEKGLFLQKILRMDMLCYCSLCAKRKNVSSQSRSTIPHILSHGSNETIEPSPK